MTAIAFDGFSTSLWASSGLPSSDAGSAVRQLVLGEASKLRAADTWNRIGSVIESLQQAYDDCSEPNWDGYGAAPLTASAYDEALALLNSLPPGLPPPEVVPEPDGSIGLEWSRGLDRSIAVSISGRGLIAYAGMLGRGSRAHGTEIFNDFLSETVLGYIQRVLR